MWKGKIQDASAKEIYQEITLCFHITLCHQDVKIFLWRPAVSPVRNLWFAAAKNPLVQTSQILQCIYYRLVLLFQHIYYGTMFSEEADFECCRASDEMVRLQGLWHNFFLLMPMDLSSDVPPLIIIKVYVYLCRWLNKRTSCL